MRSWNVSSSWRISTLCLRVILMSGLNIGAFQLYDINGDGFITYDEMLQIVRSIYKMTGQMVKLPVDEDTPEKVRSYFSAHCLISWNVTDIAFNSFSEWTKSSGTWTRIRMLVSLTTNLWKGANKIRLLYKCVPPPRTTYGSQYVSSDKSTPFIR